jgi:hypothetical protein
MSETRQSRDKPQSKERLSGIDRIIMASATEQQQAASTSGEDEIEYMTLDSKKKSIIDILGSVNITEMKTLEFRSKDYPVEFMGDLFDIVYDIINDSSIVPKNRSKTYVFEDVGNKITAIHPRATVNQIEKHIKKIKEKMDLQRQKVVDYVIIKTKKSTTEGRVDAAVRELSEVMSSIESINSIPPEQLMQTFKLEEIINKSLEVKIYYFLQIFKYLSRLLSIPSVIPPPETPDDKKSPPVSPSVWNSYTNGQKEDIYKLIISVTKLLDNYEGKYEREYESEEHDSVSKIAIDTRNNLKRLKDYIIFDPMDVFIKFPDLLGRTNFDNYFSYEKIIKPHNHQIKMTNTIYNKINSGFFIAYTSPTGSGKTMSCVSIAKLIDSLNRKREYSTKPLKLVFACNSSIVKNQIGTYLLYSGSRHLETRRIEGFDSKKRKQEKELSDSFNARLENKVNAKMRSLRDKFILKTITEVLRAENFSHLEIKLREDDKKDVDKLIASYREKLEKNPQNMDKLTELTDSRRADLEKKLSETFEDRLLNIIKPELTQVIRDKLTQKDQDQLDSMRSYYFFKYRTAKRMRRMKQQKIAEQKKMEEELGTKYGPYYIFEKNIRDDIKEDIKNNYSHILEKEPNYFEFYLTAHSIVTDTESAVEIVKDLENTYDVILFFDEPTMGADQYGSEELSRNCKLLLSLPKRTILSSATIFNFDRENILYKSYKRQFGMETPPPPEMITGEAPKNGCLLKGYDQRAYPSFSTMQKKDELEKAITCLENNMFFNKTCTLKILFDLNKKMKGYKMPKKPTEDEDADEGEDESDNVLPHFPNLSNFFSKSKNWSHNKAVEKILVLLSNLKNEDDTIIKSICDYDYELVTSDIINIDNLFTQWSHIMHGTTLLTTTDAIALYEKIYPIIKETTNKFRLKVNSEEYFQKIDKIPNTKPKIINPKHVGIVKEFSKTNGDQYNKLADLLEVGIGVYSRSLNEDYLSIIEANLNDGNLVYLIGDDSIIYGADFSIHRVFIDEKFSNNHSIESLIQVIGRAGRNNLSSEVYIPKIVMCRIYEYIVNKHDEMRNESFNIETELFLLNNKNKKNKLLRSIKKNINDGTFFNKSQIDELNEINGELEEYLIKCLDKCISDFNTSIELSKQPNNCKELIAMMKDEFERMIHIFDKKHNDYLSNSLREYIALYQELINRKVRGIDIEEYSLILERYKNSLKELMPKEEEKPEVELTEEEQLNKERFDEQIRKNDEIKRKNDEFGLLLRKIQNIEDEITTIATMNDSLMKADLSQFVDSIEDKKILRYDLNDIIVKKKESEDALKLLKDDKRFISGDKLRDKKTQMEKLEREIIDKEEKIRNYRSVQEIAEDRRKMQKMSIEGELKKKSEEKQLIINKLELWEQNNLTPEEAAANKKKRADKEEKKQKEILRALIRELDAEQQNLESKIRESEAELSRIPQLDITLGTRLDELTRVISDIESQIVEIQKKPIVQQNRDLPALNMKKADKEKEIKKIQTLIQEQKNNEKKIISHREIIASIVSQKNVNDRKLQELKEQLLSPEEFLQEAQRKKQQERDLIRATLIKEIENHNSQLNDDDREMARLSGIVSKVIDSSDLERKISAKNAELLNIETQINGIVVKQRDKSISMDEFRKLVADKKTREAEKDTLKIEVQKLEKERMNLQEEVKNQQLAKQQLQFLQEKKSRLLSAKAEKERQLQQFDSQQGGRNIRKNNENSKFIMYGGIRVYNTNQMPRSISF